MRYPRVKPTELGERVGREVSRERPLDDGRAEALVLPVTDELEIPLEERDRGVELAAGNVGHAEKGRRHDLDRGVPESLADGQGLLPEPDRLVVVAAAQALDHHESGDSSEPLPITECPGEGLRLVEMLRHACPIAKRKKRVPELDAEIDGQLGRLPGLRKVADGP